MLEDFTRTGVFIDCLAHLNDEGNVNYPPPKGGELLVFASLEPLVLTQ